MHAHRKFAYNQDTFFLILNNLYIKSLLFFEYSFLLFFFPTLSGNFCAFLNEFAPLFSIAGKFRKLCWAKLSRFIPNFEQFQIFFNARPVVFLWTFNFLFPMLISPLRRILRSLALSILKTWPVYLSMDSLIIVSPAWDQVFWFHHLIEPN